MCFYGFFQTDVLINFFISLRQREAITWKNFVPTKRNPGMAKEGYHLTGMKLFNASYDL